MRAVILAAGFGTRLYPLTQNKPKALLEVGEKTLLDHLVEKLEPIKSISEITVVTNGCFYLDFFRWRKEAPYKKPIRIQDNKSFVPEKRPGAVRDLFLGFTAKKNSEKDCLVLLGDNYFDFPIAHFLLHSLAHPRNAFIGTYDLKQKEKAKQFGVLELDGHLQVTGFEEKPENPKSSFVSVGVYYLPKEFQLRLYEYLNIERLNPDRIGDFIGWLSRKETLYAVEFDGRWSDVGDLHSLRELKQCLEDSKSAMIYSQGDNSINGKNKT